jgi:hypothetical protein
VKDTLYNNCDVKLSLNPAARTDGTVNGTGVDLHGSTQAYRSALAIIHTGAITDGTHTFSLQDSSDNTNFTDVADEFLQGTEPAIVSTDDNEVHVIGYTGSKRYLRVKCVTTGATSGGIFSAVIVLGGGRRKVTHS